MSTAVEKEIDDEKKNDKADAIRVAEHDGESNLEPGVRTSGEHKTEAVAAPRRPEAGAEPGAASAYMFSMAWTIAKREIRAYFDSLIAYVVIGGPALLLGLHFFLYQGGFWQANRASMTRMFDMMPLWLCVVIPLVTMRALSEEKRSGTLELLITLPVHDASVILGKYLGAMAMCAGLLAVTLLYPISMFVWPWHLGPLDWGPVWAGYVGLLLYCSAGCALGLLFSSLTESQVISFFFTGAVLGLMYAAGAFVESTEGMAGNIVSFLSFQSRFTPFARGLIDTRAVVYFVSVAVLALLISFRSLERRKWT